jgi:hypothetical protein
LVALTGFWLGWMEGRSERRVDDVELGKQIAYSQIRETFRTRIPKHDPFFVYDLGMKVKPRLGWVNTVTLTFVGDDQDYSVRAVSGD